MISCCGCLRTNAFSFLDSLNNSVMYKHIPGGWWGGGDGGDFSPPLPPPAVKPFAPPAADPGKSSGLR